MRYIGRWIGSLKDTVYPPPHELAGEYDRATQSIVVDYLINGHVLCAYRGFASCLYGCNYSDGYAELTDGKWVWPCDLAHYVDTHSILVPQEFIADVVASIGLQEFNEEWRSQHDEFDYWRDWCEKNATGHLRNHICAELHSANQKAEELLNAMAQKMAHEHGLSSIRCIGAGCTNTALLGKYLCARCCLKGNEDMYVSHLYGVDTALNG